MRKVLAMALLLALVLSAQYLAWRQRPDVNVTAMELAGNPVERYEATTDRLGVVLVAHGFSANKEMMRPWGYYLAQQGFDTYIFDQPGHGHATRPLPPELWNSASLGDNLRAMVDDLVSRKLAEPGKIGLVGHSMGGLTVTLAGLADDRVRATVALSSAYRDPLPVERPVNFLSLAADRDVEFMVKAVQVLATQSNGGKGELGKQYGSFREGTAREADIVAGRNHLTIIYDDEVMSRTGAWLRESLASRTGALETGGFGWAWVTIALLAALAFVGGCMALLAPAETRRSSRNHVRVGFLTALVMLAVAAFSAVLAVVYLRIPWPRLAVLDYLLPYYLVMAGVLLVLRLAWPREYGFPVASQDESDLTGVMRGLGAFLGFVGAAGPVLHMNLSNYMPTGSRFVMLVPVAVALWLYFAQEEALKRAVANDLGPGTAALVGLAGKLVIVLTWLGSSALPNPQAFLPLTIPVLVVLFVVLEVFSFLMNRWRYPASAAATFTALVLAWTTATSFPVV